MNITFFSIVLKYEIKIYLLRLINFLFLIIKIIHTKNKNYIK